MRVPALNHQMNSFRVRALKKNYGMGRKRNSRNFPATLSRGKEVTGPAGQKHPAIWGSHETIRSLYRASLPGTFRTVLVRVTSEQLLLAPYESGRWVGCTLTPNRKLLSPVAISRQGVNEIWPLA